MGTIADKIKDRQKAGDGVQLTSQKWDAEPGDVLAGEIVHREVITRKEDQKTYDKVVVRTDDGLFDTIIPQGVLAMAEPPVERGDLIVITYNGLVPFGDGKRSMHSSTVVVYPVEHAPF